MYSLTDTKEYKIGQLNQDVIFRDLANRGLLITPTVGKNDFDGFLPDGRSVEVKLDILSQVTNNAAIEEPSILRYADFYIHTLTSYRVYPQSLYHELYMKRGRITEMGEQRYEGRLIPTYEMKCGMYASEFVKLINQV